MTNKEPTPKSLYDVLLPGTAVVRAAYEISEKYTNERAKCLSEVSRIIKESATRSNDQVENTAALLMWMLMSEKINHEALVLQTYIKRVVYLSEKINKYKTLQATVDKSALYQLTLQEALDLGFMV